MISHTIHDRPQTSLNVEIFAFSFVLCVLMLGIQSSHASLDQTNSRVFHSGPIPWMSSIQLPHTSMSSGLISHTKVRPHLYHQFHSQYYQLPLFFDNYESLDDVDYSVDLEYYHPFFIEVAEEEVLDTPPLPPAPARPIPHSLIIEERCGTFITIDWPKSGILYENGEPEPCP